MVLTLGFELGTYVSSCIRILIGSHSSPIWSPSPFLQLVSEPVWSFVGFNRLCYPKATWRKMMLSLWSSMARISIIEKTELAIIS
jgi:hypothetical protein